MRRRVTTRIDQDLCIGCGECVRVCPSWTIEMHDDKAVVTGEYSIGCGHCLAVCPAGAVSVGYVDEDALWLKTIPDTEGYLAPGESDAGALVRLMRSRRSCRNYQDKPVSMDVLEDLVRIGTTAPSGTNSQAWTFTLVPDRDSLTRLGEAVGGFFRKLSRMAGNPGLRLLSKVFMKDTLGIYHREYDETVREGLRQWDQEGRDRLFHGAQAAILVGSEPGASCPAEDALLASQNIVLAAHAMGLGTVLVGFIVEAIRHDARIKRLLDIPPEEKVHAVIALGYPDESYEQPAGRRRVEPRISYAGGDAPSSS